MAPPSPAELPSALAPQPRMAKAPNIDARRHVRAKAIIEGLKGECMTSSNGYSRSKRFQIFNDGLRAPTEVGDE
jgi:hypothetical protein